MTRAFLCYPGGASHVATIAGADAALAQLVDVAGVSGVSAGGLVAIARAFGVSSARLQVLLEELLQDSRILDINPFRLGDAGLCAWDVLPKAVDKLIGPGRTFQQAAIPLCVVASNLDTGTPRYLSSWLTPEVKVREAARATSAIPGVAPTVAIPSLGTSLSPDIRLHTDGGVVDNTTDAVFDDEPAPRIALRLRGGNDLVRVRHGDNVGQLLSIFRASTWAASRLKSTRSDGLVIDLPAHGSGFDFDLTPDDVRARWVAGYDAVMFRAPDIAAMKVRT
jgi:predicted acylesterase/phospholipase RssA